MIVSCISHHHWNCQVESTRKRKVLHSAVKCELSLSTRDWINFHKCAFGFFFFCFISRFSRFFSSTSLIPFTGLMFPFVDDDAAPVHHSEIINFIRNRRIGFPLFDGVCLCVFMCVHKHNRSPIESESICFGWKWINGKRWKFIWFSITFGWIFKRCYCFRQMI